MRQVPTIEKAPTGAQAGERRVGPATATGARTAKDPVADRLAALLKATAAKAKAAGLTDEAVETELAADNAERRA